MTPSTQPRYIDIFTRLSHRNTPKLCKIQHDLAVRTQHNGRIQNCMFPFTPRLKSQPSFPWNVNWSYTLCLHWCVLSWDGDAAFQPKRHWNPSKHHPLKTVRIALDMQCLFSTSVAGSLDAGGSQRYWVAAWHSKSSYHVDLLQSRKTSLPQVSTTHFLLVNRRSGLTPILK